MLIDRPWGVSTSGEGRSSVEPDHAVVRFAINRLTGQPATSLAEAKAAAASARASLAGHGITDRQIRSSRTNLHSIWDGHGASRRLVGHQCRVELSVRIEALDVVDACLVDLVDAGADEILGVTYDTSRRPELWDEARRQAVESATAKAVAYADACGITLGPVVHIEDADPRTGGRAVASRMAVTMDGPDGDPLVPGSVIVEAAVVVGFSIAG